MMGAAFKMRRDVLRNPASMSRKEGDRDHDEDEDYEDDDDDDEDDDEDDEDVRNKCFSYSCESEFCVPQWARWTPIKERSLSALLRICHSTWR